MRILVADDDPISLEILRGVLEELGHEVICARDGQEAFDRIVGDGVRLAISDWEMPCMTGLELCRRVRQEASLGYVYFILLTGHDSSADVVAGLSAGADDFVRKPFCPEELAVRIRTGQRILGLETRDVAIFAMAKLAESRDVETGAHLERVRSYCDILTHRLMLMRAFPDVIDDEFLRLIVQTSPLHDIGKVGIPDSVLLKPGRLSDREFEIMKTHTTLGAATLGAALTMFPGARFLQMARDIAATHHEHFDGAGYPAGLIGQAIPLPGRIVAVADVYDALTSKRVYKNSYSHEVAHSILVSETGSHFDPIIVEAFLASEEQFLGTCKSLADPQLHAA
ncbi:MAG: response regulator [Phycisphaeraceae bacterium]|nr:response regulator [Phycisphaeraceae bacterium]